MTIRGGGAISVTVDDKKVQTMLEGYIKTIPKGADIGAKKVAGAYATTYLQQMDTAKIKSWTGRSFNILRDQIRNPVRIGKGEYAVIVPGTLIALDQMQTHSVPLKKGSSITRWATRKFPKALKTGFITVHPHPWIQQANKRARKNIQLARKEIRKALVRKGR